MLDYTFFFRGQRFLLLNVNAMSRAMFYGLMVALPIETLTRILIFTKQSSTPALAYRRFKANGLHAQIWFQNKIEPGSLYTKICNEKLSVTLTYIFLEHGNHFTQFGKCMWS